MSFTKEQWANGEFRKKMSLINSGKQKKLWTNSEYRDKQTLKLKASKQTESFKKNQSKAQKLRCENPVELEKYRNRGIESYHKTGLSKLIGVNHPSWKGGISKENGLIRQSIQYREWQHKVLKRDKYTCCDCHQVKYKVHTHHLKAFSEYPQHRFDVNNGITLCKECHRLRHINEKITSNLWKKKSAPHFEYTG